MQLDTTGKIQLDHIYTQPDPRDYFRTLRELGYCIPQLAKPYFTAMFREEVSARARANASSLRRCDEETEMLLKRIAWCHR